VRGSPPYLAGHSNWEACGPNLLKMRYLMKRKFSFLFAISMIIFMISTPAHSNSHIEWRKFKKISIENRPLDVAVSLDDKWIFILNDKGNVLVYSKSGKLSTTINVGKQFNQIKVGPRDNLLFLTSKKDKTVEIIEFELIREINTIGSPFKGPVDAPVVIALFTDFQ
jgi:hypothetical protein